MSLDIHFGEFSANITHNLGKMADACGCYDYIWRPEENNVKKAKDLIIPIKIALKLLKEYPDYYKTFNPSNGFGTYEHFIFFLQSVLQGAIKYSNYKVKVWR